MNFNVITVLKKVWFHYWVTKIRYSGQRFKLGSQVYHYFCHRYNTTWRNERAVEVPIIWSELQMADQPGKKILELGNVLAHYFPIEHIVVDKYETAPGVINEDVVRYRPKQKFDMVISISTLEHVGWDEQPRQKLKTQKAVAAIRKMLARGGRAVITFPVGYNPYLDELLWRQSLGFDELKFLRRVSWDNRWVEITPLAAQGAKYGHPFENANVIVIGYLHG